MDGCTDELMDERMHGAALLPSSRYIIEASHSTATEHYITATTQRSTTQRDQSYDCAAFNYSHWKTIISISWCLQSFTNALLCRPFETIHQFNCGNSWTHAQQHPSKMSSIIPSQDLDRHPCRSLQNYHLHWHMRKTSFDMRREEIIDLIWGADRFDCKLIFAEQPTYHVPPIRRVIRHLLCTRHELIAIVLAKSQRCRYNYSALRRYVISPIVTKYMQISESNRNSLYPRNPHQSTDYSQFNASSNILIFSSSKIGSWDGLFHNWLRDNRIRT